jgi:hypothetical protein
MNPFVAGVGTLMTALQVLSMLSLYFRVDLLNPSDHHMVSNIYFIQGTKLLMGTRQTCNRCWYSNDSLTGTVYAVESPFTSELICWTLVTIIWSQTYTLFKLQSCWWKLDRLLVMVQGQSDIHPLLLCFQFKYCSPSHSRLGPFTECKKSTGSDIIGQKLQVTMENLIIVLGWFSFV